LSKQPNWFPVGGEKEARELKASIGSEIIVLKSIIRDLNAETLKNMKEKLDMSANRIKFYIGDI